MSVIIIKTTIWRIYCYDLYGKNEEEHIRIYMLQKKTC